MGAGNSKPEEGLSQHVFKPETPTRYSGGLVGSLQDSPQSDATRTANLELKIQSRVTSELERLAAAEAAKLKSVAESISQSADDDEPPAGHPTLSEKLQGKSGRSDLSRDSVAAEIEALKRKLEGRKKVEEVDPAVQQAKEDLVQCLRLNDRRPLDCWKEKEAFKREVARLERQFVERTVR